MPRQPSASERALCREVSNVCAANQLRRAAREITQRYDAALAPSGVRVTQLPILVAVRLMGPVAISPLAERLGLDRTTLTRNLKLLAARGLVEMSADADDARMRIVALTDDGVDALAQGLELWKRVQSSVEHAFGEPRLHSLYGELAALTAAGSEH